MKTLRGPNGPLEPKRTLRTAKQGMPVITHQDDIESGKWPTRNPFQLRSILSTGIEKKKEKKKSKKKEEDEEKDKKKKGKKVKKIFLLREELQWLMRGSSHVFRLSRRKEKPFEFSFPKKKKNQAKKNEENKWIIPFPPFLHLFFHFLFLFGNIYHFLCGAFSQLFAEGCESQRMTK